MTTSSPNQIWWVSPIFKDRKSHVIKKSFNTLNFGCRALTESEGTCIPSSMPLAERSLGFTISGPTSAGLLFFFFFHLRFSSSFFFYFLWQELFGSFSFCFFLQWYFHHGNVPKRCSSQPRYERGDFPANADHGIDDLQTLPPRNGRGDGHYCQPNRDQDEKFSVRSFFSFFLKKPDKFNKKIIFFFFFSPDQWEMNPLAWNKCISFFLIVSLLFPRSVHSHHWLGSQPCKRKIRC